MRNVGRLIKEARLARGLRQRDVAGALGLRSVHYIGMLEGGLSKGIGLNRLEEIADVLGVFGPNRNRWIAAAEHLPPPLKYALFRNPDRWDEVLALLSKPRGRAGSSRPPARAAKARATRAARS
jgi:transcriptional regulator with XRE-family HTH domain